VGETGEGRWKVERVGKWEGWIEGEVGDGLSVVCLIRK
jgi:hypothetical protein